MDKIEKYKKRYPIENGIENLIVHSNGKVTIPKWLLCLMLHSSGLKSRKKRIVKKVLKNQLIKLIQNYEEQVQPDNN